MPDETVAVDNTEDIEEIGMSIAARVIYQLGEQLISDEFVALAELIKNGYDADATVVRINVDTNVMTPYGRGRIIVEDNGNGMTQSILATSFMRISTNIKKREKFTPYFSRRVLGEKGLGRLSMQRLGHYAQVETSPRIDRLERFSTPNDYNLYITRNTYIAELNWKTYEESDEDFTSVRAKCTYRYVSKPRYGTRIMIEGLNNIDFWNIDRRQETRFRSEIFGLVNPFMQQGKQKFEIEIVIDGKHISNNKINESLIRTMSDIVVDFRVEDWKLHIEFLFRKPYLDRLLQDQIKYMNRNGFSRYEIHEPYSDRKREHVVDLLHLASEDRLTYLRDIRLNKTPKGTNAYPGDFTGVFYALEQSSDGINSAKELADEAGQTIPTIKELKSIWQAAVGVYLFRNDFRILPYGPEIDWLDFTTRSQRTKANAFKSHTVSGYVQLDGVTSEQLREQTNRQGIIEDDFGRNFMTLVRDVISYIAFQEDMLVRRNLDHPNIVGSAETINSPDKNVVYYRDEVTEEQQKTAIEDVRKTMADLLNSVSDSKTKSIATMLERKLSGLESITIGLTQRSRQENAQRDQQIAQLKTLAGLAGQGIIIETFTHELHRIEANIGDYARSAKQLLVEDRFLDKGVSEIARLQDGIIQETVYLQQQLGHLEPTYRRNQLTLSNVSLGAFLEEIYTKPGPMSRRAATAGAKVLIKGDSFDVQANKGILVTIFDNLFINGLYWVASTQHPEIHFEMDHQSSTVVVWDTGPGFHPDILGRLFEPYVSMKPDGRGLGLYIVKELLRTFGASITYDDRAVNHKGNFYRMNIVFPEIG